MRKTIIILVLLLLSLMAEAQGMQIYADRALWASTTADNHYRLTYAGSAETLSTFTLTKAQVSGGLPYISIPLADTKDVYENTNKIVYTANDVSVGDLDGDGEFEIVVKRLQN